MITFNATALITQTHNMKSTHNKSTQPDVKYPCLMVAADGDVVLFHEKNKGLKVVKVDGHCDSGFYSELWDMSLFTMLPATESVTLQND